MNSGSYSFLNPLTERTKEVPPHKNVIVYTGTHGSGKTWQAQTYARIHGIAAHRILWSELKTRLALVKHIHSNHYIDGCLFLEEYTINDADTNALLNELAGKGFKILITTLEEPLIPLPKSFIVVKCAHRKEVANA